jgi:hypothetical protein
MFDTSEERIAALQIPDSLLCRMSTSQLLATCLDYPYIKVVLFAENIETGIDYVASSFNGFAELIKRQDFITSLINKEQQFPIELESVRSKNSIQRGNFSFKTFMIDFLLLQHLSMISDKRIQEEAICAIEKSYEIKKKNKDLFGAFLLSPNLMTSIQNGNNKGKQNRFSGGYGTYVIDSIYTPKGTLVSDTYRFEGIDCSFSSDELDDLADNIYNTYNGAILIAPPSLRYNCHGYAWNVSEGGDQVWIGFSTQTAEDVYWTDGSYIQTTESDATKVSYTYGNHSAIRLNSTWYQSKWGNTALVQHHPNDVPPVYNASQGMTFYKRAPMHISGPTVPCGTSTYVLENLFTGCTVQWSLQNHGTPSYLIQNSPSINMCQINATGLSLTDNLIANVYSGSNLVATVSKAIDTSDGFTATYSQPSYTLLGHTYPAINNCVIHNGGKVIVGAGGVFTVTSSDFVGATITQTSGTGVAWSQSGSTLTMQAAISTNGQTASMATFLGEKGCQRFTFKVLPFTESFHEILDLSITSENGNCIISLIPNQDIDSVNDIADWEYDWTLTISNVITGKKNIEKQVSGNSTSVDTSKLEKGVYVVKAKIGNYELSKKITL